MIKFRTHIISFSFLALTLIAGGVFYTQKDYQKAYAVDATAGIGNSAPVFTATPSDGGSDSTAPTNVGSSVSFTATAKDIDSDQYYLSICKTDAISPGYDTYPTCTGGKWPDANPTVFNSESPATETYTAQAGDAESNTWYSFVCDKRADNANDNLDPKCYPAPTTPGGDTGRALGTITFTGVPEDTDNIAIDDIIYEFDSTVPINCSGENACVDISESSSATDAAIALDLAEAGESNISYMVQRGAVVYIYADSEGASGNAIEMDADVNEGGSTDEITLSGATLAGGSDSNASPFLVNHAPTFGTVTVTDDSDGEINPGDTLRFTLLQADIADADTSGGQDTINMFICDDSTTSFNYTTNICTGGSLVCSDLGDASWLASSAVIESGTTGPTDTPDIPVVAMDASGNAIAVWRQTDGSNYNIWGNIYTASTDSWGTAVKLENEDLGDAHYPQIDMNASGVGFATWVQNGGGLNNIWAIKFENGAWGIAGQIESASQATYRPDIAVDSSGNAIAVWEQNNGPQWNIYTNKYTSGSWGVTPELLESNDNTAISARVDFDGSGNAIAVWSQSNGVTNSIYANHYTSGSWGSATLIEDDDGGPVPETAGPA